MYCCLASPFLFFNHPATTEIYTLSLHDALPISNVVIEVTPRWSWTQKAVRLARNRRAKLTQTAIATLTAKRSQVRSEEHTSELQSLRHLVCRLLLEKKKIQNIEKQDILIRISNK